MRPKRNFDDQTQFEDPLKNYDGPEYADELERVLAEGTIGDMDIRPFTTVRDVTPISETMALMAQNNIACVLVTDADDKLVGIFSERDVLEKVTDDYLAISVHPVRDVMTESPNAVYETDCPAKAMNIMASGSFRHVPVIDVDDRVVGILGPRRVTGFIQRHLSETDESASTATEA